MQEKYLPVSPDVYDALIELQSNLQKEYGENITVSDTIDFLGHQFFVHTGILDLGRIYMSRMSEHQEKEKGEPGMVEKLLTGLGLNLPKDATCFMRSNIDVPMHWMHTRWVLDIQGKNILRCLTEPVSPPEITDEETTADREIVEKKSPRKVEIS